MHLPDRPPLRRTEGTVQGEIRSALARVPGVIIFRNNVGALRDERVVPGTDEDYAVEHFAAMSSRSCSFRDRYNTGSNQSSPDCSKRSWFWLG